MIWDNNKIIYVFWGEIVILPGSTLFVGVSVAVMDSAVDDGLALGASVDFMDRLLLMKDIFRGWGCGHWNNR